MLRISTYGPVTQLRFQPQLLGRSIYHVSAFFHDATLIDTGPPATSAELVTWAGQHQIEQILNTHHHEDHIGGNAFLDIPAYAPAATVAFMADPERIPLYRRLVWGQPRAAHATPLGDCFETRHEQLQVIPTPGQAPDHVAFLLPERGWLFSGDLYVDERTRYVRTCDDVPAWIRSLRKILAYDFDTLFCAHSGFVLAAKEAIRRKLAYWMELRDEVHHLSARGWPPFAIRDRLLGPERFLTYLSRGEYGKLNLVEALLQLPETAFAEAVESRSGAEARR